MPFSTASPLEAVDLVCWIQDVTIIEVLGEQALHVALSENAGLGESLVLPLGYFPFLERELATAEPACGWVAEGAGITSAVYWPLLGQRCTVNKLHSLYFEYQMATMYAGPF
ncbi:hypothetical protein [Hymenobacter sp. DG01]|uniref:hypothetical protein n=1 Tax=Hymenobacter sp. DG01 TaxID=2584940 RepID=UPI00111F2DE2|nr:hypothetical protein [Hymenobacter sp. DG01]